MFTSLTIYFSCQQTRSVRRIKSIHICHLWVLKGFSAESGKDLWLGNSLNLKLNTRLPTKKIRKLDVAAFREEGKRFKSNSLVEDQLLAI